MFERFNDLIEQRFLPLSASNYMVTLGGKVKNALGVEIKPTVNSLGNLVVNIDWIHGEREYEVALLIAHTFKPLKIESKWWKNITVMFADGNKENISPANLVWKFPIGLGAEEHSGFAFIPMFTRYMINKDGLIFDTHKSRIVNGYNSGGYHSYALMPDVGRKASLKRHRALCLVFKGYPNNVDEMAVNHKDGKTDNNDLDNLEWVTHSENSTHALSIGLINSNKPVVVRNIETNEEKEYISLTEVCKQLGLDIRSTSIKLRNPDEDFIHGNFELRYKFSEHRSAGSIQTPVLMRNMLTDEVTEFESVAAAARITGKSLPTINGRINSSITRIYEDFLQFKRKSDPTPWHKPKDPLTESKAASWSKMVLVKNLITGKVTEYQSQRIAAAVIGVGRSTITEWLASGKQPVYKNPKDGVYYQIKKKSDTSEWQKVLNPEERYRATGRAVPVLVRDIRTGTVIEYSSAAECAKAYGMLATTLNWRLKSKGKDVYPPGIQVKYKSEPTPFADIDPIVSSIYK